MNIYIWNTQNIWNQDSSNFQAKVSLQRLQIITFVYDTDDASDNAIAETYTDDDDDDMYIVIVLTQLWLRAVIIIYKKCF